MYTVSDNAQNEKISSGTSGPVDGIQEMLQGIIEAYSEDAVGFVKDVLGAEPDDWQVEFLTAVQNHERRISIRAGHGVGKSTGCAWVAIWHMVCRYPQKTIMTAPTAGQLFDALFAEVKFWVNRLPEPIRNLFEVFSDRIVLKSQPEASFMSARTSSADKPEALAGIHSEHVLLIADEASAIPEQVYESAAGSMSGEHACTVLIGNPTRNSGLFFKTHHQLSDSWYCLHVSCLDSKRVSADFVQQISNTYGEESNAYRVRVLGEFAVGDDDTLIGGDVVDAAFVRDIEVDRDSPIIYGVDVARFGDDRTVICKRRGNVVLEFKSWAGRDLMETVGWVANESEIDNPAEINVDSIGLGAGVADRLRELGYNVRDVNVSEAAAMNPKAFKLRDDLWMSVRDWLNQRACKLPPSDELRQELVSPRYTFQSNGKLKVESKGEMKKRGMRSPDFADSLCLTFAGNSAMVGGRVAAWSPGKSLKRGIKGIV